MASKSDNKLVSMNMFIILSLVFILIEILLLVLFFPTESIIDSLNAERKEMVTWFGQEKTVEMIQKSESTFNAVFLETGIVHEVYEWFTHDQRVTYSNEGIHSLSQSSFFMDVEQKIHNFWLVVKSALLRFELLKYSAIISLIFIIPTIIDAIMVREANMHLPGNISANVYDLFKLISFSLFLVPIVIVLWPFAISPIYVSVWAIALAVSFWFYITNTQEKV